jgi:hypothetical protein
MDWVSEELSRVDLGDVRRDLRLMRIVQRLTEHAEQSLPAMTGSWAECKAAYRFWSNEAIAWRAILAPHRERTVERAQAEKTVLVIQDHTDIDLSTHRATQGLGYLVSAKAYGLLAHTCLAVSEAGVPLGIVDLKLWTRPLEELGKRYQAKKKSTAEKESQHWLDGLAAIERALPHHPHLVVVADREADIYAFFAAPRPDRIDLLVRVCRETRNVEHPMGHLREALAATPWSGTFTTSVPRSRKRAARQARLRVRFTRLSVFPPGPPQRRRGPAIPLHFVEAEEVDPPSGEKPIRWVLAVTAAVTTVEHAHRVVGWYARRWTIERFHYVFKSGYGVERQQLESLASIERFFAVLAIVAWRVLWLTYAAREHPQTPCTVVLDRAEWQTLYLWMHRKHPQPLPGEPLTLVAAVAMIGRLGGHLGRTRDGPPGVKSIWRGLARLSDLTDGYLLAARPP